jgi:hypothetical protein
MKELLRKDKISRSVQKLGNAYYFNSEFDKAAKWYGIVCFRQLDFGTQNIIIARSL